MKIRTTTLPDVYLLDAGVFSDNRGLFVKTFVHAEFSGYGLVTEFAEEYFTLSLRGVLRGLHFQTPPFDHYKIVSCLHGQVLDAVVDLRVGSPTYGAHEVFELSGTCGHLLYLPPGIAHGFYAQTDNAVMAYKVTTPYSASHDSGILWNSAGIPWPDRDPVISARDAGFLSLEHFESPFIFAGE